MKIIGLVPVRNESWVLAQSLEALSGFCDVVIVNDQQSTDDSRAICRRFSKVVLLESEEAGVCEQARWRLLDAARDYAGHNLLWWSDADEMVSPVLARAHLERDLEPGTAIECLFYHLWGDPQHFRDDYTMYRPHRKAMAIVDDRRLDYDRSEALPLHQPRVSVEDARVVRYLPDLPVFHLQWLLEQRNQMKQAWYRCREWLNGDKTAAEINHRYALTLLPSRVRTTEVPAAWVDGLTFPDLEIDRIPCWQEADIRAMFASRGPAFFEPLEIWHIPSLRREFLERVNRRPRPDRSYRPSLPKRARSLARRAFNAGRRRLRLGA